MNRPEPGIPDVEGDAPLLAPTVMAAVPAVMDRIRKAVTAQVEAKGKVAKWLFETGYARKAEALQRGRGAPFWDRLLFDKIRTKALGGRLRLMLSGGGPLGKETQVFM